MLSELHRRKREPLILAIVCLGALSGSAQNLQGRFYPEKDSYMVGEPVLFNVEIKNTGAETVYLHAKNPGKCVDRYEFFINGPNSGCGTEWVPGCQDESFALDPEDSSRGQWELNSWYEFEREGKYTVNITRHVPIESIRGEFRDFTFSSKFDVKIETPDPLRLQTILQEFESKLNSNDPDVRHSALDVLASTAPAYFESVALRLSRDKDPFKVFHATAALGRINTAETRAALADIITTRETNTQDEITARIRALEGLGHSGDESYLGLVGRYLDDQNQYIQLSAMAADAQLGKVAAVPQIRRYLSNPNPTFRKNAAYALRFSTTPEAVEALIGALNDKDANVREDASTSLKKLVGNAVPTETGSPEQIQERWRSWWRKNKSKGALPDHIEFICHMK